MHHCKTLVHVSHEPPDSFSHGEVFLRGLLTAPTYRKYINRSIIIGPANYNPQNPQHRLGPNTRLLFASIDGILNHPFAESLALVERKFNVRILYGQRDYYHPITRLVHTVEVVHIDVSRANLHPVNALKSWMYEEFGLPSDRYEHNSDYDKYVKIAPAALATLRAINASDPCNPTVLIAHDFIGVPTALAAMMDPLAAYKAVFFAHEVPGVRGIIENHPGHDTRFYNAKAWANDNNYYLGEIFGPQDFSYQHALTLAARHCDNVLTSYESAADDLRFLGPNFDMINIDTVPHGLHSKNVSLDEKLSCRTRLLQYAHNLFDFTPDHIFTHTAPLQTTGAFWRDLRVLQHLEHYCQQEDFTAVYFLVNRTAVPAHPLQTPDATTNPKLPLTRLPYTHGSNALAADFQNYIHKFNIGSRHIKAVLVNESDLLTNLSDRSSQATPHLNDFRIGSDLEFAQGIYDPHGSNALEALAAGSLAVVSNVTGCTDTLQSLELSPYGFIVGDYTRIDNSLLDMKIVVSIDQFFRNQIEDRIAARLARIIMHRLPSTKDKYQQLIDQGRELREKLSWDCICREYFLPAIDRAYHKHRSRQIA